MEQQIRVKTFIKLDRWDALKCFFGRALRIDTDIVIPQENPIERYNAVSYTSVIRSTGIFVEQDRPPFGYTQVPVK